MKSVEQLPRLFLLRRLFHYLNDTDTALSLRIYKYYIRPHFEYACPVGAVCIQQNSRLEKLHLSSHLNIPYNDRVTPILLQINTTFSSASLLLSPAKTYVLG